jgi:hypothetical protein
MVKKQDFSMLVGRTILCNIGSDFMDMFMVEKLSVLVLCVSNNIIIYSRKTGKTAPHEFNYSSIRQIEENKFLLVVKGTAHCMELAIEAGPTLIAKILISGLKGYKAVLPAGHTDSYHLLDLKDSIYFCRVSLNKLTSVTEVYRNE